MLLPRIGATAFRFAACAKARDRHSHPSIRSCFQELSTGTVTSRKPIKMMNQAAHAFQGRQVGSLRMLVVTIAIGLVSTNSATHKTRPSVTTSATARACPTGSTSKPR